MTGRVHKHENFKGANTAGANTWLLQSSDGRTEQPSTGADQLALAQNVLNRKRKGRVALMVRESEAPIEVAVDQIVQGLRGGRLRVADVEFTQGQDQDRLTSLTATKGDRREIRRLEASIAIRGAALDAMKTDPYSNVIGPPQQ